MPAEHLIFLPHFVFIPIGCYNTAQLYKLRHNDFIHKRRISLVFGFNIVLILRMLSTSLSTLGTLYFDNIYVAIGYIVNAFIAYFVIYYLNVKSWMIYYQYHWTYYTLQLKWTQIINPSVLNQDDKSNWFIKNHYKYNNLSYVYKLFGIIHLIGGILVSTAVCILTQFDSHRIIELSAIAICVIITLIFLIFYTVIVRKTPVFNDVFYVHWEAKLVSKVLLFGYALFFCLCVMPFFFVKHSMLRRTVGGCIQIEILSMWFCLSCISTIIISRKNKQHPCQEILHVKQQYDIDLITILRDENSINVFMKYLSREFNMRNLLSYIEFNQFQQYLSDKVDKTMVDKAHLFMLPNNIPLSRILETKWSDDELEDVKIKTHYIYKKYVEVYSEFEINVSYGQRMHIINLVGNLDILLENNSVKMDDLFCIFDECKIELIRCLNSSLRRFKKQPDFREVANNNATGIVIVTSE